MSNDNSNYTVDLHSEVLTFMTMNAVHHLYAEQVEIIGLHNL